MKVGDVIVNEGKASVIIKMENGIVKETKTLEDYIMTSSFVKGDNNKFVTIEQFVRERCEVYINGIDVHESINSVID